jgi:hypothetical protein
MGDICYMSKDIPYGQRTAANELRRTSSGNVEARRFARAPHGESRDGEAGRSAILRVMSGVRGPQRSTGGGVGGSRAEDPSTERYIRSDVRLWESFRRVLS